MGIGRDAEASTDLLPRGIEQAHRTWWLVGNAGTAAGRQARAHVTDHSPVPDPRCAATTASGTCGLALRSATRSQPSDEIRYVQPSQLNYSPRLRCVYAAPDFRLVSCKPPRPATVLVVDTIGSQLTGVNSPHCRSTAIGKVGGVEEDLGGSGGATFGLAGPGGMKTAPGKGVGTPLAGGERVSGANCPVAPGRAGVDWTWWWG